MTKLSSALFVFIIFLSACSSSKKPTVTPDTLADYEWRLTELMGKAVPAAADPMNNITLKFNKAENRVSGFSGCNTYSGGYTSTEPLRIKFAQMISTMKACPAGMEIESEYLQMLTGVDNYTLNGNVLSLNKARMAPLAKFETVRAK